MTLKEEIFNIVDKVFVDVNSACFIAKPGEETMLEPFINQATLSILSAIPKDKIKKAIEILGRPVMSYAPEIAMKEYDDKIKDAVILLNQFLNEVEG
jgi:nitrogenase subunit NifH